MSLPATQQHNNHAALTEVASLLVLAILRQRLKTANNSLDLSDTGSVYATPDKES